MIQFKRGSKKSWLGLMKPLADGQPGYDRDKHKIKIGNGKDLWEKLPYASGLSEEEILCEESKAKDKNKLDSEDKALFTYGTESPNRNTIGQVYLQYYDTDPETDYVVSSGISGIWTYQKWKSGIAKCFGTIELTTNIQTSLGDGALYQNNIAMTEQDYPFSFKEIPSESASIQSPGALVWLASAKGLNTKKQSAVYSIISPDKSTNIATYRITLNVEGFWK